MGSQVKCLSSKDGGQGRLRWKRVPRQSGHMRTKGRAEALGCEAEGRTATQPRESAQPSTPNPATPIPKNTWCVPVPAKSILLLLIIHKHTKIREHQPPAPSFPLGTFPPMNHPARRGRTVQPRLLHYGLYCFRTDKKSHQKICLKLQQDRRCARAASLGGQE